LTCFRKCRSQDEFVKSPAAILKFTQNLRNLRFCFAQKTQVQSQIKFHPYLFYKIALTEISSTIARVHMHAVASVTLRGLCGACVALQLDM
jgi:hypothetical protein